MRHHLERGMATAEYTVGTLGTVMIAVVLYKLGMLDHDNPWFESFRKVLERALMWRRLVDFIPGLGIRL
ncbi:DUF4244 domain-containing protein [Aeromicrobium sp.]|uniref:DUF4244 domain-containing protein n=1 Tax=Aeromicrobium sp. TaxID=1871063 RepID=UPI001995CD48|nr:DUF4244 domain-containing protein [Aeromicrobium sp.]MBC7630282.1 DUF4244 domain-containing protein [Aeromicrobium sp.]